jgi:hypothetical protein
MKSVRADEVHNKIYKTTLSLVFNLGWFIIRNPWLYQKLILKNINQTDKNIQFKTKQQPK